MNNTVAVVGLGYVGLPTAIIAAQHGYRVIGFDIDAKKVALINQGIPPVHEPELRERLAEVLASKQFYATTTLPQADYFIIAVPTPLTRRCTADVSYVFAATDTVTKQLKRGDTVIVESTIPVGTTDLVAKIIHQKTGLIVGQDVFIAHCPERVWPSKVFYELINNNRIIGGMTPLCAQKAAQFYRAFVNGEMSLQNAACAELLKLVENSAIDVSVALAHQVAVLAEELNLDPYEVIELANKHPRVKILTPTCGVGGHCVAVDPWFLINDYPHKTRLFQAARLMNDERPMQVLTAVDQAVCAWREQTNNFVCKIRVLGLSYKPNVDDLRESPALKIAQTLCNDNTIQVTVSDPYIAQERLTSLFGERVRAFDVGLGDADIVLVLVAHKQFAQLTMLSHQKILDFSGLRLRHNNQAQEVFDTISKTKSLRPSGV